MAIRLNLAQRARVLDQVADNLRNDIQVAQMSGEREMTVALRRVHHLALSEMVYVATMQDVCASNVPALAEVSVQ